MCLSPIAGSSIKGIGSGIGANDDDDNTKLLSPIQAFKDKIRVTYRYEFK